MPGWVRHGPLLPGGWHVNLPIGLGQEHGGGQEGRHGQEKNAKTLQNCTDAYKLCVVSSKYEDCHFW